MASGASLQSMIQAVQKKKKQLEALPEGVASKMADVLILELEARTPGPEDNPLNTGTLKKALTKRTRVYKSGDYFKVGVGDLSKLQSWHAAPKGTIAAFLADFMPAYKAAQADARLQADQLRADRVEAERQRIAAAKQERDAKRQEAWNYQLNKALERLADIDAYYAAQLQRVSGLINSVRRQAGELYELRQRPYGKKMTAETRARIEASRRRRWNEYKRRVNDYWRRYAEIYEDLRVARDRVNDILRRLGEEEIKMPTRRSRTRTGW